MSFDMREVRPSDFVIAAMCGNWNEESGVNPGIWETLIPVPWDSFYNPGPPETGGYGFGQWTNTRHPTGDSMRCLNLHNWVTSNGYQDGDGAGQLLFMGIEDIWNITSPRLSIPNLKSFFDSTSTDIEALCFDFLICWEGINNGTFPQRLTAARKFLAHIQAHANDDPSLYSNCITGNRYLSEAETLHNVMYIYFALNGHLGTPDLTTEQLIVLLAASRRKFNNYGKSWIQS